MANEKKVITLLCERAADLNNLLDGNGQVQGVDGLAVVKLPCSGMIQPLMIEGALKNGAAGVLVCGCQIGDCFYREGNKMIRERMLGDRPPGLKKTVDRRRVIGLWLSRLQTRKFISDAKEFVAYVRGLEDAPVAPKPAAAPAAAKPAPAAKPSEAAEEKPASSGEGSADK
jgi:coenzyme F420-reducing hydrogenase delta subunit